VADPDEPSLLVAYPYLPAFERNRHRYQFRGWVLDSGAFTAHNAGVPVDLRAYTETCRRLIDADPALGEVFALDVIADWRAGLRNAEAMWSAGVPAVPTFHPGEPWSVLTGLARDYPKIALGGVVGWPAGRKAAFVGQCFARVWPKAVHGLGMSGEAMVLGYPFHSVDASNWEARPCRFGEWNAYGAKLSVKGSGQNLRAEVEWYLRVERRARDRWRAEMPKVPGYGTAALTCRPGGPPPAAAEPAPSVRLAVDAASAGGNRPALALTRPASAPRAKG
jgi:hypothetical protein